MSGHPARGAAITRPALRTMTALAALLLGWLAPAWVHSAPPGAGSNWPQFRGPQSDGSVDPAEFPAEAADGLIVGWKVDLPGRGASSPIVIDGRVILTASSGTRQDLLHVLAFDAATGRQLWQRQFWATGRTFTHPQTAVATPTPASDGHNLFVFFSSNDLAALDLEGNLLWYRGLAHDFPRLGNDVGMSSSPVVLGQTVVVQSDSQGEAFVAGIDAADGSTRWQLDRERKAIWTSPALLRDPSGAVALLVEAPKALAAIDPATGTALWNQALDCDTISSACAAGGMVYVPGKGLSALRAGARSTTPEVVWSNNQVQSGAASPALAGNRLHVINRSGVLIVADTADGQILSRTRLEGNFWSSPVVAGNRLLAVSFDGNAQLVALADDGRSGKVAAKTALSETIQASPAVSGGGVYVRSDGHLWKLVAAEK